MKKKLLLTAIAATAFAASAIGLAACTSGGGSEDSSAPGVHTITFNANEGQFPTTVTTPFELSTGEDGKLAALPTKDQEPTRTDYTFLGWSLIKGSSTLITTDSIFYSDATVYASWKSDSSSDPGNNPGNDPGNNPGQSTVYDITFHATNGALAGKWGTEATKLIKTGTDGKIAVADMPATPVLDGYKLVEWNTQANGKGETVDASHKFEASGDVWAIWESTGGQGGDSEEGDGGYGVASERLVIHVNGEAHNTYSNPNPGFGASTEDFIDSIALAQNDVISLKDKTGAAVQFRYKADDAKMTSYTVNFEPAGRINIYLKTYEDNKVYELTLCDKTSGKAYDKDGKLEGSTPDNPDNPGNDDSEAAAATGTYAIGTGAAVALTNDYMNIDKKENPTQDRQFKFVDVEIPADTKITFTITDAASGHGLTKLNVQNDAQGLSETGDINQTYVTTDAKGGKYTLYLKHFTGAANADKWVIWCGRINQQELAQERTEAMAAKATVKVGSADPVQMTNDYDSIDKSTYATMDRQYTASVTVAGNDTITFAVTDDVAGHGVSTIWVEDGCKGLAYDGKEVTSSTVKVGSQGGTLNITLKHYTGENNIDKWCLYTTFVSDGSDPVVVAKDVYIKGKINGGTPDWNTGLKMEQMSITSNDNENLVDKYKMQVTLKAGDTFKVYCGEVSKDDGWCRYVENNNNNSVLPLSSDSDKNIVVGTGVNGTYTIIYQIWKDGGTSLRIEAA